MISLIGSNFVVPSGISEKFRGLSPGKSSIFSGRDASRVLRNTHNAIRTTQYGFTLIEIMVSVAILSIGLVLILQAFGHSLNVLRISEDNLKATFMTENKLAEAQIQAKEDWDALANGLKEKFEFEDLQCVWEVKITSAGWEGIEEIAEEYENLNEVKATLTWKEGKRKGEIPLVTYMRSPIEEE